MKKTLYVQPSSHNNQYTEYKIPSSQLKNFRLIDFGVQDYTKSVNAGVSRQYNTLTGAISLMDTISLYNDTELINQCRNCDKVMEFSELSEGAMMSYSKTQNLIQNQMNLDADLFIEVKPSNINPELGVKNPTYIDLWRFLPFLMGLDLDKFSELQKAIKNKDRKKVKQILKTSNVIHANKLNLRLVIEYSTKSPSQLFVGADDSDTYNIIKPVLVCDEVNEPVSNSFQVVYDNWDNEMVTVVGGVAGTDKREDKILYGCIGKYLSDVWILNTTANELNDYLLNSGSYGLLNESVNLVVNEQQLIPNNICNTPARKQMYLNYTQPNMMCPVLSNLYAHQATQDGGLYGSDTSTAYGVVGKMSYLNLSVEKVIDTLRLYLDFKAFGTLETTLGNINVHLFYRCKKSLTYNNGMVMVSN